MLLPLCFSLIALADVARAVDLKTDIANHVKVYPTDEPNVIKVTVNTPMFRHITAAVPPNRIPDLLSGTDALYTALSCEAADWMLNEIYEFVRWSSMFNYSGSENSIKVNFKKHYTKFVTAVDDNVGRLIGVLDAVLRSADDRSRYTDTLMLEMLFALQMDVYFLSANIQDGTATQDDAYRVLAADMTAAQKYLATNCANAPADAVDPDSLTFGYWLRAPHGNTPFLSEAQTVLSQLPHAATCKPAYMMLEDFVLVSSGDVVAAVVAKSDILVNYEFVTMEAAYRLVQTAYNIDIVPWYQESVMAVVVKTILWVILYVVHQDGSEYLKDYAIIIDEVYALIASNRNRHLNLPECLINSFTVLKKYMKHRGALDEIQEMHDSLWYIRLPEPLEESIGHQFLPELFSKLFKKLQPDDCFSRCYECLRNRRDQYHYDPSAAVVVTDSMAIFRKPNDENRCDFLAIVHSTCRRIYRAIRNFDHRWNITGEAFHMIIRELDDVRGYVQPIVDKRTRDMHLLQLAYDVATVLANIPRQPSLSEPGFYVTDVQRYLNVIVSFLGYTGLRWYCRQPNAFVTFRWWYVSSDNEDAASLQQRSMVKFYKQNLYEHMDANRLGASAVAGAAAFDPLNVNNVYEAYVAPSCVITALGDRVLFAWKGWPITLTTMFRNAVRLPVDMRVLISLYDAYFTFYVAAACYEITRITLYADSDTTEVAHVFKNLTSKYALNVEQFPDSLKQFVINVVSLLASFDSGAQTDPPEAALRWVKVRKRIVNQQLVWLGIKFNDSHSDTDDIQSGMSTLSVFATSGDGQLDGRASDFIAYLYCVFRPYIFG